MLSFSHEKLNILMTVFAQNFFIPSVGCRFRIVSGGKAHRAKRVKSVNLHWGIMKNWRRFEGRQSGHSIWSICSIVRLLDLLKEHWSGSGWKVNKWLLLWAGLVKDFSWRQSWSSTSLFTIWPRSIDLFDVFDCSIARSAQGAICLIRSN